MAGAGASAGADEWIYVPSQQEEATEDTKAEQAVATIVDVTATTAGEENNKPSKKPDYGETAAVAEEEEEESNYDGEAGAQPSESKDSAGAAQSSYEKVYQAYKVALSSYEKVHRAYNVAKSSYEKAYPAYNVREDGGEQPSENPAGYTPEELEIVKAFRAYIAAYRRAMEMHDEIEILKANRDVAFRAYCIAADSYAPAEEPEIDKAFEAYMAAVWRAAEMDDELQIQLANRVRASRAYVAALQRASATKLDGGGDRNSAAAAGRDPRVLENPYYDRYSGSGNDDATYGGAEPGPYYRGLYGGDSAPASLGPGSGTGYGYDNTYDNRYGFGFPGAATGLIYGYGYGYNGCYFGEPYASYRVYPYAYRLYPLPTPNPYLFYPAPTPAPVSIRRPGADELSAVAPTTTQPLEPFQ